MKRLVLLAILILGLIGTQIQATDIIKPRVLVSTDIGGTDPDDNQSMAHLLMYMIVLTLKELSLLLLTVRETGKKFSA